MLKDLIKIPIKPVVLTFEEATRNKEIIIIYNDDSIENAFNDDGFINDTFIQYYDNLNLFLKYIGFDEKDFETSFSYDVELTTLLQKHNPDIKFIYLASL